MKNGLNLGVGVVMVLAGALWTLQGLDLIGGSAMSGQTVWAVVGPIIGVVGAVWIVRRVRGRSSS